MQTTTFIYALSEGENVRYIGKANNPQRRYRTHLRDSYTSHKCSWIKSLLDSGITPTMEIVDEVPLSEWEFWEQHYMSLYNSWGFDLVNMREGGAGGSVLNEEALKKMSSRKGWKMTEEQRKRISEAKKGKKLSTEQAAAFASYWKGRKQSEEHKEKRKLGTGNFSEHARQRALEVNVGRKLTDEHKAKISPAGRKHSEETKAKIGSSQKGRKPTPEALENQRLGQQRRWAKVNALSS